MVVLAFANQITALPVIAAIEHDHHLAFRDVAEGLLAILLLSRQPKPQHIHRRAKFVDLQASPLTHDRTASIATDRQVRANLQWSIRRGCSNTDDAAAVFQ